MDCALVLRFRRLLLLALVAAVVVGALHSAVPQDPGHDPGDGPREEVTPVLVFPNITARDWLEQARASLNATPPDPAQAVRALGELLDYQPAPEDPSRSMLVHEGGRVYRNARSIARELLRTRVAPEAFRQQFDGLARRQFDAALATLDVAALASVVERYPLATCYPDALRALADAAFDVANFPLAARVLGRVAREFPARTPGEQALQLARWQLCAHIAQDTHTVAQLATRLRGELATARFTFAGRDWTGASFDVSAFDIDRLQGARRVTERISPVLPLRSDSPLELPPSYGEPLWSREADRRNSGQSGEADAHRGLAIAVGNRLILPGPGQIVAVNLVTGGTSWSRDRMLSVDPINRIGLGAIRDSNASGPAQFVEGYDEVLVDGGRVAVLAQVPWANTDGDPRFGQRATSGRLSVLAVFDTSIGAFEWGQALFRGEGIAAPDGMVHVLRAPTETNGRYYVPLRAAGRIYLACLDPVDGRPLWVSMLHDDPLEGAAAGNGGFGPVRPFPGQQAPAAPVRDARVLPVVVADDVAYVVSNVGGVSAVDALTGELQWVTEFAPDFAEPGARGGTQTAWNVAPVIIGQRLLFAVGAAGQAPPCRLRVIDTTTGRVINDVVNVHDVLGGVTVAGETRVIIQRGERQLAAIDGDGDVVWTAAVSGSTGRGTIVDCGVILWPCGNRLKAFDLADGAELEAPGIRPDLSKPLGDLTLTGGFLVSRHERGTQIFLDTVRAAGFVADTLRAQPNDAGGHLLDAMQQRLLGDTAAAVAAVHRAAERTRDRETGQAVLERWMQLLDDRARAGEPVPNDELEQLQAFAGRFGNPLSALTLPVRLELQAGRLDSAAAFVMQMLLAERRELLELDGNRKVVKPRLVAQLLTGWRESAGEAFGEALAARLGAALQALAADDADMHRRTRLLDLVPDFPGVLDHRLALATAARADRATDHETHRAAVVRHHAAAVLAAAPATPAQRRLAAALLLAAGAQALEESLVLAARAVLAADAADEPLALDGETTTVGEWLARFAAVAADRAGEFPPVRVSADAPFAVPARAEGVPVAIAGSAPATLQRLALSATRDKLTWIAGGDARELALPEIALPRGRPVPPSAVAPLRAADAPADGVDLIVDTGLQLVGVDLDAPAVRWSRSWVAQWHRRPATTLVGPGGALAGLDAQWSPMLLASGRLVIADLADARARQLELFALDIDSGEVQWRHDTGGNAARSSLLTRVTSTGALLYRDVTRSLRLLDPADGRVLANAEPGGAAHLLGTGADGLVVLAVATRRGGSKPNRLLALATPPVFRQGAPLPNLPLEWQVDCNGEVAALEVVGRLVIAQEGPMLCLRRIGDGGLLAQWPGVRLLAARPLPDGRVAIAAAVTGDNELEVRIVDPLTGSTAATRRLSFRREAHHRVAAAVLQPVVNASDGTPRLIAAVMRMEGSRTVRPGEPIRVELFALDVAPGNASRTPDATVATVAPDYAMVWQPGFLLRLDGSTVVVAPDGDKSHHRVPLD